ncbi:MAG: hypothetical protein WAN20_11160 [Pseudonocardiaceae bacterium]
MGNSLGARIALELARRDRAPSVVAIARSGVNMLPERIYQGVAMSTFRLLMYVLHPAIGPLACFTAGRTVLLTGLRSQPWLASEVEASRCGRTSASARTSGVCCSGDPGRRPHRARERALSGDPGPGTDDVIGSGQTPATCWPCRARPFSPCSVRATRPSPAPPPSSCG